MVKKSSLKAAVSAVRDSSSTPGADAIPSLESRLTGAAYDPNDLVPLTALARHADPAVAHKAVWALYRVWVRLVADGRTRRPQRSGGLEGEDVAAADEVVRWTEQRLDEYVDILRGAVWDVEASLRVSLLASSTSFHRMRRRLTRLAWLPPSNPASRSSSTSSHPSRPPRPPQARRAARSLRCRTSGASSARCMTLPCARVCVVRGAGRARARQRVSGSSCLATRGAASDRRKGASPSWIPRCSRCSASIS